MFKEILFCALFLASCASSDKLETYRNFGEKEGIKKIVDDLFVFIREDERIKDSFANVDLDKTKHGLTTFICVTIEGPCKYEGQSMRRAHKGLDITESQFYSLVESLQKAMDLNNVPQRAQNKLLAKFAAMHKDVIGI